MLYIIEFEYDDTVYSFMETDVDVEDMWIQGELTPEDLFTMAEEPFPNNFDINKFTPPSCTHSE